MDSKRDKRKFAQVMAALGEVFDLSRETSALKTELYFKSVAAFDIDAVERAAITLIQTRTQASFPKPAEIIQAIRGTSEEQSTKSWAMVDDAMRKYGNYQSLNFGDKKIHRCIELMGGWEYLGTLDETEWKWKRKEFESLYESLAEGNGPQYVAGIIEKSNLAKGYDPMPVIKLEDGKNDKVMIESPNPGHSVQTGERLVTGRNQ